MAFHLATREQAYRDDGVPEPTARQLAQRRVGNTLEFRKVWQDTTQRGTVWDRPIYEAF